jgi:RNA polymerase sigma-70 factor (ECF subfamily)
VFIREDDPLPPEDRRLTPVTDTVGGLYRSHQARLTRFLARRLGAEIAPDLVHRVFLRFMGLAPEKRADIDCVEAYLMRSARNLARDEHKVALRRNLSQHISDDTVPLTAPCQIAALEARDMLGRIEQSIEKLKPITRQIFLAHRLDGYSYAEIADRTGLSVKGVEKHMSRAIAHIDRTLASR